MLLLTVDQHRELFADTGYSGTQIDADPSKGWICATGRKPQTQPSRLAGLKLERSDTDASPAIAAILEDRSQDG